MDVLLHPSFATNRLVYLSYGKPSANDSSGTTTVVRGRLESGRLVNVEEIFEANALGNEQQPLLGEDGVRQEWVPLPRRRDRLYPPDMMAEHPAQDLTNHYGKIIRLARQCRVPADNPLVRRADALPEIWSWGHRNMQGLAVHPAHRRTLGERARAARRGRAKLDTAGPELRLAGGLPRHQLRWLGLHHGVPPRGVRVTPLRVGALYPPPRASWVYTGDRFPWWRGNIFVGGLAGEQPGTPDAFGERGGERGATAGGRPGTHPRRPSGPGRLHLSRDRRPQ